MKTTQLPPLFLEESHDLPICRLQFVLKTGASSDEGTPTSPFGLCHFATELMRRGAGGKNRAALDETLDGMGSSLSVVCHRDSVVFELVVLKEKLHQAYPLLRDVVFSPDFLETEAEKLRREIASDFDEMLDDDGTLSEVMFSQTLYGNHPYGRLVTGTRQEVAQLTTAQARWWHATWIRPNNLLVGAAGDITREELEQLVANDFTRLQHQPPPVIIRPAPPLPEGVKIVFIDKPERTQTQILMGHLAPPWTSEDWLPLHVGITAFGGTFTSKLMQEIRVKRGFSYGASASLGAAIDPKALIMHVFPAAEQSVETVHLMMDLYKQWPTAITPEDVEFAKNYLASSHAFSVQTPESRLKRRIHLFLCGMTESWLHDFPERVRSISFEQVRTALRKHLRHDALLITLVSTADVLLAPLQQSPQLAGSSWQVIPHDQCV